MGIICDPCIPNYITINDPEYINNTFRDVFKTTPVKAFSKNTSLRQIIGGNTIRNSQKLLKVRPNATKGECTSCDILRCLFC